MAPVNIAFECTDRHVLAGRGERVAIRWSARDGRRTSITYASLAADTARFANVLADLGVEPGECVAVMTGRVPALHIAVLGALRHRAVACVLFSSLGPEPVGERLAMADARVLVTTAAIHRRTIAGLRGALPRLRHVLLVDDVGHDAAAAAGREREVIGLAGRLASASSHHEVGPTEPATPALLHFTSGTTGPPKGAVLGHGAMAAQLATARSALDLHRDDVLWCTADPGWVTGVAYGIVAPLALGATTVVDEADFDAERWCRVLDHERVTVWYTAPTALRMLMRSDPALLAAHPLPHLRWIASVGEPLHAAAIDWARATWGLTIHDTWWQTETGAIMLANPDADGSHAGSIGRPVTGVEAAVLRHDPFGRVILQDGVAAEVHESTVVGELALRPGGGSMFQGYLDDPVRTAACFAGGWYLTGDLVRRDADGWYWFVGRADDVITSSGHRIGPAEIEDALRRHPAVADVGVIGRADPTAGEIVHAVIELRGDVQACEELRLELIGFGRRLLGAAIAPKEIEFVERLPTTSSGKVSRRMLRDRAVAARAPAVAVAVAP